MPPSSSVQARHSENTRFAPLIVCAVSAILYVATLRFDFVYDDQVQIVLNPLISSWSNLPWLFRTDVWGFWNPLIVGNYWRPLFMVWLLLNHSLFGLNPAGWHAFAVLTHVVATYFVYKLSNEISGDTLLSTFAALIFAVHPCHLETVAWVSGATDSLMADFLLPSLLCFIRGWKSISQKRWILYGGAALLYLCALLIKETAAVMPAFALAYVVIFGEQRWALRLKSAGLALIPVIVVSLAYLAMRQAVLHGMGHPFFHMSVGSLLVTIPSLLWFYCKHLAWPVGLGVFYDLPPIQQVTWHNFGMPLLACILILGGYGYLVWRTRDRLLAFAGVLLLLPIIPVLYIPALPPDSVAHDRYLYLPSIGFAMIVAHLLRQVNWGENKLFSMPLWQFAMATVAVLGLAVATSAQQIYWANDLLLFRRAIETAPGNATAYNNLGTALTTRGRMKEARFAYEQVARRNPRSGIAQYNLGLGYFIEGNYPQAESHLTRAVALDPMESDAFAVLAESEVRQGKFAAAETSIRRAIALKPYKPGYRRVLSMSLEGQGKIAEAVRAAEAELKAHPEDQETKAVLNRLLTRSPD